MFQIKPITLSLLLLPVVAYAADVPVFQLDDVVVTATRQSQKKIEALADISVVTADEIANSGAQTLSEVLQTLPGIESSSSGGRGKISSLFVRGTNSNQTVVLVDGVRMNLAASGIALLQHISLSQVDRIEVVRGSASSIYGADAIGGVIQIFTKGATAQGRHSISMGYGNKNSAEAVASTGGKIGALSYQVTISHENTDGFSTTNQEKSFGFNPDKDGYRNTSFSGSLGYEYLPGQTIKMQTYQNKANSEFDQTSIGQDETRSKTSQYILEANNQINEMFSSTVRLSEIKDKSKNFNGGSSKTSSHFYNTEKTMQALLQAKTSWGGLVFGAEKSQQKIDSNTKYSTTARKNSAGFFGLDGKFGRNLIETSARVDNNQQFGSASTGRFAYGFEITPELVVKASFATALKAPTFNDLYWPKYGNPNLAPEKSKNTEVGVTYRSRKAQINWVGFYNEINNLIIYQNDNAHNRDARIKGTSLEGLFNVGDFTLRANATYQDPRDLNKRTLLPRRARVFGNIGMDYTLNEHWLFSTNVHISAQSYEDVFGAGRVRHAGYSTTNLSARYQITNQWQTSLSFENLFDKKYVTANGYNTSPLSVFFRMKYEH